VIVSKIAVIGCGRIAWKLEADPLRYKPCTHLGALRYWQNQRKSFRISAFCDLSPENAAGAARFMGTSDALLTTDFQAVIKQKPDVLVVAASTAAHFPVLAAALRAQIPRIVLEKPVAFSAAEVKKISTLLKKSRNIIIPNYERRYHPKYLKLKKRIAGKAPSYRGFFAAGGKSLYADAKTGDEGVLLHDTTHLLDLAQFFFGSVVRHRVIAGKRRHVLYLEHADGATGVLETSLGIGVFHLELEIHTKKERITVGNGFLTTEKIQSSPHYKNLRSYGIAELVADAKFGLSENPFVKLYKEALFGKPDNAHFTEALENVRILSLL
jgi:predicted dehydrogenase